MTQTIAGICSGGSPGPLLSPLSGSGRHTPGWIELNEKGFISENGKVNPLSGPGRHTPGWSGNEPNAVSYAG